MAEWSKAKASNPSGFVRMGSNLTSDTLWSTDIVLIAPKSLAKQNLLWSLCRIRLAHHKRETKVHSELRITSRVLTG